MLTTHTVTAKPLCHHCHEPWLQADHAVIGVSPFNSYFSQERLTHLTQWAVNTFSAVSFFLPDQPTVHTLQALGYTPERARVKARRQSCYTRNKIRKAADTVGITESDTPILDAEFLTMNTQYRTLHTRAEQMFHTDAEFRSACLRASSWVLARNTSTPTSEQAHLAVRYLLAEIPLWIDTASIVGASSSVFCYHQAPEFLTQLFTRQLPWHPQPTQGFAVVCDT